MRPFRDTRLAALQSFAVALLLGGVGCSKDPAAPGASSIELIVVSPPAASVVVGGTLTLNAEVRDADGGVMQDARVSWASEDTTIASVSPDGVVTARNVGTVLIAASARGKDAFATVTVNPPAVSRVVVSPQDPRIKEGETVQLRATVYDANNKVISVGVGVAWASANASRVTVSSNGLVLGVRRGNVVVSATAGGKTGSTTVHVED